MNNHFYGTQDLLLHVHVPLLTRMYFYTGWEQHQRSRTMKIHIQTCCTVT